MTIDQAVEAAKSQNIKTKLDVTKALNDRGISEQQARQIAASKGISYDSLLNQYFEEGADKSKINESGNDTSILVANDENNSENNSEISENIEYKIKGESKKYFGYDIFKNNPYLNKEYLIGNIDEGYLISPGDEIRIIIYGDNSLEVKVKVDKNGNINIPNYGLFFASGMSFKTLKSRLKIFLGKYLSGLVSVPQKTFMDVSLTELKPTKVVVLGQVSSPGPHILTTSGSALAALYSAGGVNYNGSLREIIIYRNNKKIKTIDLYDYITTGKLKDDIRLTNNDIVFVPNRKNSVELKGELTESAIYEFLENEDLSKLIDYSGGLLPTTQTKKVNIQRIIPAENRSSKNIIDRKLITINYQELINNNEKINLIDGDQIIFFRILDLQTDQVTISGHVFEPGTYSLKTYPTLKSLVFEAAKGYIPDAYLDKVDVYSEDGANEILNSYNFNEIILGEKSVNLSDNDRVIIYSNTDVEGDKSISISGFGIDATTVQWKENFSLYDFIFSTSKVKDPDFLNNILETRIDLKRYSLETGNYFTIYYDYNNIGKLKTVFLQPRDKVILYNKNVYENTNKKVSVYGYVRNPLETSLEDQMFVEDLILLAGGLMENSNSDEVVVNRYEVDASSERLIRKYIIELDVDYMIGKINKPKNNFTLRDKDIVTVTKKLGFDEIQNIKVKGEVNFPQNIIVEFKNSSFKKIIDQSGGLTKYANLEASYLKRDGKILAYDLSKKANKISLIDGDEIFIASNKGIVQTTGGIENESNFIWRNGRKAKYYIRSSGGKVKRSSNSYIIHPNGNTKKIGFLKNPKVLPNSIINVNFKPEKIKGDSKFLDDFNRTFGILASTLTTILVASKL
tara:strand:+ start:1724 stop:4282 length:2559 start_codon:yes stop_codon:yes gene_type:complete